MSNPLPTAAGRSNIAEHTQLLNDAKYAHIIKTLVDNDQAHLFSAWSNADADLDAKRAFLQQILDIDTVYPGGIRSYIQRAQKLLQQSAIGANPYEGYTAEPPSDSVTIRDSSDIDRYESIGLSQIEHSGYVCVAGGLGERLGYKGIKLALPSEITTETTYIELYIKHILALQQYVKSQTGRSCVIPLGIMTSDDTDALTRELLQKHNNYGMTQDQLTIFKQGKVPSMIDNDAHFTLDDTNPYRLDTKPHGHGDVHSLLYSTGLIKKWVQNGTKWVVFLQDTNGLIFHALPSAIGVSVEKNLHMNTITVPRVQGDAVGAICKLTRGGSAASGSDLPPNLTINVEYNQLEGLLGKGTKEPLAADGKYSVYPGNTNVLVFNAVEYLPVLEASNGAISEFVNPKYNPDRQSFKKPTRLECMMQDYPKLLTGSNASRVSFTQYEKWTSFSAVKNAIVDAVAKQKAGNAPESGASGMQNKYAQTIDVYNWFYVVLKQAGVQLSALPQRVYAGVSIDEPPHIVLAPRFGVSHAAIKSKFSGKQNVVISAQSTLVIDGTNVKVQSLHLDGALLIHAVDDAQVTVQDLSVHNAGWQFKELSNDELSSVEQKYAVRGYTLQKRGAEQYVFDQPGQYILSNQTKSKYAAQTSQ